MHKASYYKCPLCHQAIRTQERKASMDQEDIDKERLAHLLKIRRSMETVDKYLNGARENLNITYRNDNKQERGMFDLLIAVEQLFHTLTTELNRELAMHGEHGV